MNKQLDLLITLRDNINVTVQTLLATKDVTGDTLRELSPLDIDIITGAEEITRELMYDTDPTTDPNYEGEQK